MTAIELKNKIKHIGGLCFALAMDINANLTKEQELTEQVKILQAQLSHNKCPNRYTEEQRLRHIQQCKDNYARKKALQPLKSEKKQALTEEQKQERNRCHARIRAQRIRAEKKAEREQATPGV